MPSKYWIKLYHEILHDPKMGRMPDRLWRRTIELFLLAGELDQDGTLPSIDEIAWTLRTSTEECNETLHELKRLGVTHCNNNETWVVTHFLDRQSASTGTERVRAFRDRKRREIAEKQPKTPPKDPKINNDGVTQVKRNVTPDTDTDTDTEVEISGPLCSSILKICKQDLSFVERDKKLKDALVNTLSLLVKKDVTPEQVAGFEEWRQGNHWTGKSTPTFKQVGEFWGQYQGWLEQGKPAPNGIPPGPTLSPEKMAAWQQLQQESTQ